MTITFNCRRQEESTIQISRLLLSMRCMYIHSVCSQHSFGLPLRMNGMHRTHFNPACLDLLSLVIWSHVFRLSLTWNFMVKIMSNHSNSKINMATFIKKIIIIQRICVEIICNLFYERTTLLLFGDSFQYRFQITHTEHSSNKSLR